MYIKHSVRHSTHLFTFECRSKIFTLLLLQVRINWWQPLTWYRMSGVFVFINAHDGWRHQIEPFPTLLALCVGNSPVTGEFPFQRPVTRSFYVFFDLCVNNRLIKQSGGWWFVTPPSSLWRHHNDVRWNQQDRSKRIFITLLYTFTTNHHLKRTRTFDTLRPGYIYMRQWWYNGM